METVRQQWLLRLCSAVHILSAGGGVAGINDAVHHIRAVQTDDELQVFIDPQQRCDVADDQEHAHRNVIIIQPQNAISLPW